jgi:hypothetical protein
MTNYAKHQPPVTLICPVCGKPFTREAWYVRKKRSRNAPGHLYCSAECFYSTRTLLEHSSGSIEVQCKYCGKTISRQPNQIRRASKRGPFCSRECSGKWNGENLVGENSPAWKGGKSMRLGSKRWQRQRRLARERDHDTCQECGATSQNPDRELDVHHIKASDLFADLRDADALDNLVTLCRRCHVHKHKLELA